MRRFYLLAITLAFALPLLQGATASAATTGIGTSVVKAGPKNGGGEPSMAIAPDNSIYISYPGGGMNLVRSFDGGVTWTPGTTPESPSGDTSVNVDSSGRVYESNLNVINGTNSLQVDIFKSFDKGDTWPQHSQSFLNPYNSSGQPFFVDRQWIDCMIPLGKTTNDAICSLEYHDFVAGTVWVSTSKDGARTFGPPINVINSPLAIADSYCNTIPGGLKIVPQGKNPRGIPYAHPGRIFAGWLAADAANAATGCNETQLAGFHSSWIAYSDDQGATWTDQLVFDAGPGHDGSEIFADLTLDDEGNPYVAFPMNLRGEYDIWVSASYDGGVTWMVPVMGNRDNGTHYFAAVAAGLPGRVDVTWIETSDIIPSTPNGKPSPGADSSSDWRVGVSQSLNFNSGQPSFTQSMVTPTPMHHGDVCTLGLFCAAVVGSNRDLLDFNDIQIDQKGRAHIAFTGDFGTYNGIYSANQVSGPTVGAPGH